jgi:ribosome-associated heat shock protein Hsp15
MSRHHAAQEAQAGQTKHHSQEGMRIDKWLWVARFHKTRSLAVEDLQKNRISINGQPAKPSREVHPGDRMDIRQPGLVRTIVIKALSAMRGPAIVAQALYEETPESLQTREAHRQRIKMGIEPALSHNQGRPTKKDRRDLVQWDRWQATAPDETS